MSVWSDIQKRSAGEVNRKEDEVQMKIEAKLASFRDELAPFTDLFLEKAKEAFKKNDRYTCAIFYTLYAIALNTDKIDDEDIVDFLKDRVFIPEGKISADLHLDDAQKKDLVEKIFDRSFYGFGHSIASLDFSQMENEHLPFETKTKSITFFDFIGICKQVKYWPDIRVIW